jgi:hypothetical protein
MEYKDAEAANKDIHGKCKTKHLACEDKLKL